jgi:hypothetical protein
MINPGLSSPRKRKRVGGGDGSIFDNVLAGAEMPPGIGIGRQAHGHGEDGDKEDGNEEARESKGRFDG